MKKNILWFAFIFLFFSCKENKKILTSNDLKLINNSQQFHGGLKEFDIKNKDEINFITQEIKKLKNDKSNDVLISVNKGFVEIKKIDKEGNEKSYFSVIFTEDYGDIIRYNGKHYYYNQNLVNFIKQKLKMYK